MYMRDLVMEEKLFYGPEAEAWRLAREESDKPGDIYGLISASVLTELCADTSAEAKFWLDHQDRLRTFCKKPVMTIPYGATKWGMLNQILEKAKELKFKVPFKAAELL